jgi:diguanylate cyclase (GGDEF)-like protein
VICALLWTTIAGVAIYAVALDGTGAASYLPAFASIVAFACLAEWSGATRTWRSISASMGLLAASAALIDISGGLIEMHFMFFVVIVVLTLYEDWVPFLLAVAFVLIHHGVMGTLDPRAVFSSPREWRHPWAFAALHAGFIALAGVAGVTAWGLNERVRDRMRETQAALERIGLTDSLTGIGNRRALMAELERILARGVPGALAIFDLNGFKGYNDRFGHPAGDSLLVRLTGALRDAMAPGECAYRLGGDEFCVLAETASGDVPAAVERWTGCLSEHGDGFAISATSGTTLLPVEAADPSAALRLCDRRMYAVKHGRRVSAAVESRDVLLAALAARHTQLGAHAAGVASISRRVGLELGLSVSEIQELGYAAELHDIGKVAIPGSILDKPGPLDEAEWEFIRGHTVIGERILAAAPSLVGVARIVRATHERLDGGGYPDGIAGGHIPLPARIISVCDAYDAMTSPRPYRRVLDHEEALAELRSCAGSHFDPAVVDAFIRSFPAAPPAEGQAPAGSEPRSGELAGA